MDDIEIIYTNILSFTTEDENENNFVKRKNDFNEFKKRVCSDSKYYKIIEHVDFLIQYHLSLRNDENDMLIKTLKEKFRLLNRNEYVVPDSDEDDQSISNFEIIPHYEKCKSYLELNNDDELSDFIHDLIRRIELLIESKKWKITILNQRIKHLKYLKRSQLELQKRLLLEENQRLQIQEELKKNQLEEELKLRELEELKQKQLEEELKLRELEELKQKQLEEDKNRLESNYNETCREDSDINSSCNLVLSHQNSVIERNESFKLQDFDKMLNYINESSIGNKNLKGDNLDTVNMNYNETEHHEIINPNNKENIPILSNDTYEIQDHNIGISNYIHPNLRNDDHILTQPHKKDINFQENLNEKLTEFKDLNHTQIPETNFNQNDSDDYQNKQISSSIFIHSTENNCNENINDKELYTQECSNYNKFSNNLERVKTIQIVTSTIQPINENNDNENVNTKTYNLECNNNNYQNQTPQIISSLSIPLNENQDNENICKNQTNSLSSSIIIYSNDIKNDKIEKNLKPTENVYEVCNTIRGDIEIYDRTEECKLNYERYTNQGEEIYKSIKIKRNGINDKIENSISNNTPYGDNIENSLYKLEKLKYEREESFQASINCNHNRKLKDNTALILCPKFHEVCKLCFKDYLEEKFKENFKEILFDNKICPICTDEFIVEESHDTLRNIFGTEIIDNLMNENPDE